MSETKQTPPLALIVFGASGDLTARKILPALAKLADRGYLSTNFTLIGVARTKWSDDEFRDSILHNMKGAGATWQNLISRFRYISGDYTDDKTFDLLHTYLEEADQLYGCGGSRVYYLATVPDVFPQVVEALAKRGCNIASKEDAFTRLVIEKPYGHDLASAVELDRCVHAAFTENQVFRIDHYMGKETVQNVLALRFANAVFEPLWNRRYVEQIQITVAESLGVGHRGGFYETAGALRDMVQNHVMQVLALTLMEPPNGMDAEHIRSEKVKLLNAVAIPSADEAVDQCVRAQYSAGVIEGEPVVSYLEELDVSSTSTTETYVALRLQVENWRWAGVPIYVRTGKRLPARVTEVALQFHRVPHLAFEGLLSRRLNPNVLILRIQPDEGISLEFGAKVPGEEFRVQSVTMDFSYQSTFGDRDDSDGYPRLLYDAMLGDATLFIRSDEVEQAWRIVAPYQEAWNEPGAGLHFYQAGTWGPEIANLLLRRSGDSWRVPVI